MTSYTASAKRIFLNKRFFLHVQSKANIEKAAELIKVFGGQIDQFLDGEVSYVLTDIPKQEWPPQGTNELLKKARSMNVKLMSSKDLIIWCSQYLTSQSSSDDDDETKANINHLQDPYIKIEDINCHYSPTVREFSKWPEIDISNIALGRSIFSANHMVSNSNNSNRQPIGQPVCQTTCQPVGQQIGQPVGQPIKKMHQVVCEICCQRIVDKIEEHIQTPTHRSNTEKLNWSDVDSVMRSVPRICDLNMHLLSPPSPPDKHISEPQEFLCLHKVESVSQLFHSHSSIVDRKLKISSY